MKHYRYAPYLSGACRMKKKATIITLLVTAVLFLAAGAAFAQTGGGYDLTWSTVDGGGGVSTGGGYTLSGTAGQFDAGALSGGSYTLAGGFWSGAAASYKVYLPVVIK
jgi:hypothetical protein